MRGIEIKLKKTSIATEEIDLTSAPEGKELRKLVKYFTSGKLDDVNELVYLVEQNDDHDVLYTVQFNLDDSSEEEVYRDIYLSCRILDYTIPGNLLIEVEEGHIDNYGDIAGELFEQLEKMPCATMFELTHRFNFVDYVSNGFSASLRTKFEAEIKLLDI